jgi:hypothetical protein
MRTARAVRPDWGALRVLRRVRSLRDDELLRAIAAEFAANGLAVVAPTDYVPSLFAAPGHLAGPAPSEQQEADIRLGAEVAAALGAADVGQTVVVKDSTVLAVEAVEGTDECIRRGALLGGAGVVVVKRSKPGQDRRFDLPAAGPTTVEVLRESRAAVLAVEVRETLLLDAELMFRWARELGISIVGYGDRSAPHNRGGYGAGP